MKTIILLVVASLAIIRAAQVNVHQCKGVSTLGKAVSVETTDSSSNLKQDTVLKITYDLSSTMQADDEIKLKIILQKKVWLVGYIKIPETIYKIISTKIDTPQLKYVGDKTFQFGCPYMRGIMTCPPPTGKHTITVPLKKYFDKIKRSTGTLLRQYIGTGDYKIHVEATILRTGEQLACVDATAYIKL